VAVRFRRPAWASRSPNQYRSIAAP
jgi:hypothetical protein